MIWIAFAILFVVALFLIKNKSMFKSTASTGLQGGGLTYKTEVLGDLVTKDTDGDGVPDWEESLWGTDPMKKDTNGDGVPDNVEIDQLKQQQAAASGQGDTSSVQSDASLTQTDKFSRELFSTIATLNQSGTMDQATVDKLSSSLADQIKNATQKKVYVLADLKVSKSESLSIIKSYDSNLTKVFKKQPVKNAVVDILQKFTADPNNPDTSVLPELDPIITQMGEVLDGMLKTSVPQSFVVLHLDLINNLQKVLENLNNIKLYDTDTIVAFSAINQYGPNTDALQTAAQKLSSAIDAKLK